MKASRYNVFIKGAGTVYAVNLLSRSAMEFSPESYDAYLSILQDGFLDADEPESLAFAAALKENMFLMEDDIDEMAYIRYRSHAERFDKRQLGLVIAPTLECNFNCHYCYEDKTGSYLCKEAQTRIIQMVAANLPGYEHLNVQWFGGEPLKAMEIIEYLSQNFMQLAAGMGVKYAATAVTNGYRMNEDTSKLFQKLNINNIQISLDGDRELHDKTRYEHYGEGTFDTILENIRVASKYLSVKLRVHVAPFNIESVIRLIDRLGHEGMAGHISELYFAPLFNYKIGMQGQPYNPDGKRFMTSQEFASVQVELLRQASMHGFRLKDFLDASYGICTAVRENVFVVDPNGNFLKCYKDVGRAEESTGTLEQGLRLNANFLKWMDIQIPRDEECRDCICLPICLGGCSKQWNEGASKDVICTPLRFNSEEIIRLYFESEKTQET